jgi:hypothetical protein
MSLDYKNYDYGTTRASADDDTVEYAIIEGIVKPQAPDVNDLLFAAEWLALYASGSTEDYEIECAQRLANVVAFLELTAKSRQKKTIIAEAKRKYAKEHGVKVSQVRIKKGA